MSKKEKLLAAFKRSYKDKQFKEFVTLFKRYGFIVDESSGRGSHCPIYHPLYPDLRWTLSKRKPMSVFHAKEAIRLVEEVIEREKFN